MSNAALEKIAIAHGSERHVAERVAEMRQWRGWSQEELARRVTAAGGKIPQSAISRLENPPPGGRRAITVDELLAFARAFEVGLLELVLPRDQFSNPEVGRRVLQVEQALRALNKAVAEVESLVSQSTEDRATLGRVLDEMYSDWPEMRDLFRYALTGEGDPYSEEPRDPIDMSTGWVVPQRIGNEEQDAAYDAGGAS